MGFIYYVGFVDDSGTEVSDEREFVTRTEEYWDWTGEWCIGEDLKECDGG
jgi:hypothetical protein